MIWLPMCLELLYSTVQYCTEQVNKAAERQTPTASSLKVNPAGRGSQRKYKNLNSATL